MKLRNHGKWSGVIRIIRCNDTNGDTRERDSEKKIRSRTESSFKDYHCSLLKDDSFRRRDGEAIIAEPILLSKTAQSKPLMVDKDIDIINNGYLSDNAVVKSLKDLKGISAKIGDKVKIKVGRSKQRTGVVSAISKKGTVKLRNYGKWLEVIRIIKCNDTNGAIWERDSEKKLGHGPNPLSKFIIVHY